MFRFVFILAFVNIAFGANDYESDIRKSLEKLNELKPLAAYYKKNPTSPQVFATGTNLINSTLNDLSEKLAAYDPASVEERNISIERSNIKFSGVLSNLNVGGFSDFVATSLSLSVLRRTLSFTIKLPELKLTTDYDIDGSISFIPIYGKGNLSLQVSGIEATGNGKVSLSNPISIETLNLGYSIGSINVQITGLTNNEDFSKLVSELLTDVVADFLNDISPVVSQYLSSFIQEAINKALSGSDQNDLRKTNEISNEI